MSADILSIKVLKVRHVIKLLGTRRRKIASSILEALFTVLL